MAMIYITCPDCTADTPIQARTCSPPSTWESSLDRLASCPGLACAAAASSPPRARCAPAAPHHGQCFPARRRVWQRRGRGGRHRQLRAATAARRATRRWPTIQLAGRPDPARVARDRRVDRAHRRTTAGQLMSVPKHLSIRQATTLAPAERPQIHRGGAENGDHVGVEVAAGSPIGGARHCDRGQGYCACRRDAPLTRPRCSRPSLALRVGPELRDPRARD